VQRTVTKYQDGLDLLQTFDMCCEFAVQLMRSCNKCATNSSPVSGARATSIAGKDDISKGYIPFIRWSKHEAKMKQTYSIYTCTTYALSLLHVCFIMSTEY